jgi:anthranilate phosphoribosyltransferase
MSALKQVLKQVVERGATLSRGEARGVLTEILASSPGEGDLEIAALLTAMATRGETVDELTGFVEVLRALAVPIPLTDGERAGLVDTCGTGGDGMDTFNISTAAALVAVAAGAKVAKHGNRAVTSKCGSADVLEALGVPVTLSPEQSAECLRATGFVFMLAPMLHPTMKRVQPIRRALGFRTIFNLAGPLTNPAVAPAQVMGVYSREKLPLIAETMATLGTRHAFVVHGGDGLDELTLSDESSVAEVKADRVRLFRLKPEEAGLNRTSLAALAGGETAEENAAILMRIFAGEPGPKREIVLLNAAAALMAAGMAEDFQEGAALAAAAIDSGAVRKKLSEISAFGLSLQKLG